MKQKWNTKLRIHACKNQDPKRKSFRQLRSESYAERNWLKGRKARVSKSKLWSTTFPQTKTLITFSRSLQSISYSKVSRVPRKTQNNFGTQAKNFQAFKIPDLRNPLKHPGFSVVSFFAAGPLYFPNLSRQNLNFQVWV